MKMKFLVLITTLCSSFVTCSVFAQDISPWTTASPRLGTHCREVSCLVLSAYELANCLRPSITSKEYTEIFEPIIFAAAEASDVLNDYGPFSSDTKDAIITLVEVLEASESSIAQLMSTPVHFETARKLKRIIRVINRELGIN